MRISELIEKLTEARDTHGDIPICVVARNSADPDFWALFAGDFVAFHVDEVDGQIGAELWMETDRELYEKVTLPTIKAIEQEIEIERARRAQARNQA